MNSKVFMGATAIISFLCFKFNIILRVVLSTIFRNIEDESVPVIGPNIKSKPVYIDIAIVDGQICTNKLRLLTNWLWDYDFGGIYMYDIPSDFSSLSIRYRKIFSEDPMKYHLCVIKATDKKMIINGKTRDIVFEEISLI